MLPKSPLKTFHKLDLALCHIRSWMILVCLSVVFVRYEERRVISHVMNQFYQLIYLWNHTGRSGTFCAAGSTLAHVFSISSTYRPSSPVFHWHTQAPQSTGEGIGPQIDPPLVGNLDQTLFSWLLVRLIYGFLSTTLTVSFEAKSNGSGIIYPFSFYLLRYAGVTLPDETDIAGCMETRGLSNKVAQQKGMTSHFINVLVHKLIH